jgi:hypothetical protein
LVAPAPSLLNAEERQTKAEAVSDNRRARPDDGFDRNMYTIVAIAAAILLVAFVVGVPDQMGHIPVPAAPTVTP